MKNIFYVIVSAVLFFSTSSFAQQQLNSQALQAELDKMQQLSTEAETCLYNYLSKEEYQYYTQRVQQILPAVRQNCDQGKVAQAKSLLKTIYADPKVKKAEDACRHLEVKMTTYLKSLRPKMPVGFQAQIDQLLQDADRTPDDPCPNVQL